MFKRLKAKLLGQKPLDDDEILTIYMEAARQMKVAPMFAKDFVRLVEAKHGITGKYKVEPQTYD
jgi:hypothetical protein